MKKFRLAFRSLMHFRLYTGINILGLALSLMCVIVIARYVYGESTVDAFNKNRDRTYIVTNENSNYPGEIHFMGIQQFDRGDFDDLRKDPAVELYSNYIIYKNEEIAIGENVFDADILVSDSNFMRIFDYPVVEGSRELVRPEGGLITQAYAKKVFGGESPVGKTFLHRSGKNVTVTGVIGTPRNKSVLQFDLIVSSSLTNRWNRMEHTAVLLHPEVDYQDINGKYDAFIEKLGKNSWVGAPRYQLYPFRDVYLNDTYESDQYLRGNRTSVWVLSIVGIFILLIGLVNFVNIYTAVILRRGKEFGLQKVFGAGAGQLFGQLLVENALMIGLSLILALALTEIFHPVIKNILGFSQLPFIAFDIMLALGLFIVIPLLTTLVPFLRYCHKTPVSSLYGTGKEGKKSRPRRLLLLLQYTLSIVMIIISLLFIKQLRFMLQMDLGFRTEDIIQTQFIRRDGVNSLFKDRDKTHAVVEEIKQKMDASPLFTTWTYGENPLQVGFSMNYSIAGGEPHAMNFSRVTPEWFGLFEIPFLEGRGWKDMAREEMIDEQGHVGMILSNAAKKQLGIKEYSAERVFDQASGTMGSQNGEKSYKVLGVTADVKTVHISRQKPPFIYEYEEYNYDEPLLAAIAPGKRPEAIAFLHDLHDATVGGEFSYTFMEDEVAELFEEDRKVAVVYSIFTGIAVLISALGLFSMSLYDIQQRRREIAIRKVNGATTPVVIRLLLRRYIVLLVVSFVIAVPVALLAIQRYLQGFAYKATVSWWIFALALAVTAGISLLTLIWQTAKAANANPADVIRSE